MVTKKRSGKKAKRKVSKAKGPLAVKRRSKNVIDNVANSLLDCDTITEMYNLAKDQPNMNLVKLKAALADAKAGVQIGLIRMRIGNLIRGAAKRTATAKSKPAKKKAPAKEVTKKAPAKEVTKKAPVKKAKATPKRRRKAS